MPPFCEDLEYWGTQIFLNKKLKWIVLNRNNNINSAYESREIAEFACWSSFGEKVISRKEWLKHHTLI